MAQEYNKNPAAVDALSPGAVSRDAEERHRAAVHRRVLGQPRAGHLRRRGLGRAAVRLGRQVRQRHRLAELHQADRRRQRRREARLQPSDDPHRGALGARRQPPRPRVQRRPAGRRRAAVLHQLGGAAVHPPRRSRGGRLWAVQALFDDQEEATGDEQTYTEGDPGRRLLLGHAGSDPQAARRGVHPGRLHRRRERERHLPQPPRARRGDRDHLRPRRRPTTARCWSSSSRSTIRPRRTGRATTSAPATARRSSTSTTSRSASRWTPSPMSTPPGCGPARSSPKSVPPATSGRPSPSTRTTSSATRAATPATSPRPDWKLPKRQSRPVTRRADADGPNPGCRRALRLLA